ncbi:choice-of-anchor X domain-containing protein, partial [Pyxidicoccus fallax]
PRSRRAWWPVALLLPALGLLGWWWGGAGGAGSEDVPPDAMPTAEAPARNGAPGMDAPGRVPAGVASPGTGTVLTAPGPARTPQEQEREARRKLWEQRLERAKRTLDTYLAATRYPPESRPGREQPDQMDLAEPERTRPLSRETPDVQLRLKQDRVFVVGDEAVHFFVSCEDAQRAPRPCEVVSASAHESEYMTGGRAESPVALTFRDSGANGDTQAGDGVSTGRFQPSKQGFPMSSGTLRVSLQVRSGKTEGTAFFDILYTPSPPAMFTGQVREALEGGSLQLYLGIQVRKAGRYVVAGRVDDESGEPFAHVSFNEELREGPQEVRLTIFGKLVLDEVPTFPLRLRDVEGFLLKEQGDPDRELMASLRGYVHTTKEYAPAVFSSAEWNSEERVRYVQELNSDVEEAQEQLDALLAEEKAP